MKNAPRLLSLLIILATGIARPAAAAPAASLAKATFAGGCFWCMEPPFEKLAGVISVTSGYTGGHKKDPTYEEVSSGVTGHAEAVQILFDPKKVTYAELLKVYWRNVDPLTPFGQFCDHGTQYRTGIFAHDEIQRRVAEQSKKELEDSKRFQHAIVTEIVPATAFYPAEDYHQDYYKKNPVRYKLYRFGCGRDARLKELWGAEAGTHE
ncbi:MAG: peptide-methionine (S)-S-oxide reductase MsrA [Thermoanaerobaculia bacterium]